MEPEGEQEAEVGTTCFRYGPRVEAVGGGGQTVEAKDSQYASSGAATPLPTPFLLRKHVEEQLVQRSAPPPPQE